MALFEGDTTDRVRLLQKVVVVQTENGPRTRLDFDFEKRQPNPSHPRRFALQGTDASLVVPTFTPHVRISDAFQAAESGPAAVHFILQAPFATQDAWLAAGDSDRDHIDFGPASFDLHTADKPAPTVEEGKNHL